MTSAAFPPATELPRLYRDRELSPVEATRAALDQISRHKPVANIFCLVDEETAISTARDPESRYAKSHPLGGLDGVFASIKAPRTAAGRRCATRQLWAHIRPGKRTPPRPCGSARPLYSWVTVAEAGGVRRLRARLGNLSPGEPRTLSG